MKRASVFLLALAIIMVVIAVPQPLIAAPTIIVRYIGNIAVISVNEPVKGVGFDILGDAEVTVDPTITTSPVLNKKNRTGTGRSVGVH